MEHFLQAWNLIYARIVVNGIDGLLDTDGNIYLSNELLQGKKIRHTESEFYENK